MGTALLSINACTLVKTDGITQNLYYFYYDHHDAKSAHQNIAAKSKYMVVVIIIYYAPINGALVVKVITKIVSAYSATTTNLSSNFIGYDPINSGAYYYKNDDNVRPISYQPFCKYRFVFAVNIPAHHIGTQLCTCNDIKVVLCAKCLRGHSSKGIWLKTTFPSRLNYNMNFFGKMALEQSACYVVVWATVKGRSC